MDAWGDEVIKVGQSVECVLEWLIMRGRGWQEEVVS